MRDDDRLEDIRAAVGRIADIVAGGRAAFDGDHILQAAALYNLQVIGEAAARISQQRRDELADVPWRELIGMRNIVVHEYFRVDLDQIWTTLTRDVPDLAERLHP